MDRLDTVVSAVYSFSGSLSSGYMQMQAEMENVRSEVRAMQDRVNAAEVAVTNQSYKAHDLADEASFKEDMYRDRMEDARCRVQIAQAKVEYVLNNPIAITETDSEGNTYTRYEIDQAALAAAQSELYQAEADYYYYQGKYYEAKQLAAEARAVEQQLQHLKKAIEQVAVHMQVQMHNIETQQQYAYTESSHNLQSMRDVCDKMTAYLNCKSIFRA